MINHKVVWAPWRMSYILGKKDPGCFLCEAQAKGPGEETLVLTMTEHSLVILNRYPYNAGHLLAVPFRAATDLVELTAAERADLMNEIILGKQILTAAIKPDAFNVGLATALEEGASLADAVANGNRLGGLNAGKLKPGSIE